MRAVSNRDIEILVEKLPLVLSAVDLSKRPHDLRLSNAVRLMHVVRRKLINSPKFDKSHLKALSNGGRLD